MRVPPKNLFVEFNRTLKTDKPFHIAGNVRSMSNNDAFLEKLVIYSGKSLVAKKYDFQVQK